MQLRRLFIAVLALSALVLAACGEEEEPTTFGKTEGAYIETGGLKYQVQISRALNPALEDDRGYFTGLSPADEVLPPNTDYFGVFIRVENHEEEPLRSATSFEVRDTRGNIYKPLSINPDNSLAYRPKVLEPGGVIPGDQLANYSPTQGALLLFKVAIASYDNRPLVLVVRNPENPNETASVDLDV